MYNAQKGHTKRVRPNPKAQDQRIILIWIKRIGIGIMVLCTVRAGFIAWWLYIKKKQHIEQQLQELQQRNEELEQERLGYKIQRP